MVYRIYCIVNWVFSQVSIDDLCKKGLDRRTQTGTQLSQVNSLISNFESTWKKQETAKYVPVIMLKPESIIQFNVITI